MPRKAGMMKNAIHTVMRLLRPLGPHNMFVRFISPNPITAYTPHAVMPAIDRTAFIGPHVSIIGDVTIKEEVFIAPNVSIRADEGAPFYIGPRTNVQDGVVLHGLKEEYVRVEDSQYSIYIGADVSCAHGSIIHGPCRLGDHVFVGFQATIVQAEIGEDTFVANHAIVTGGVRIPPRRFVPPGAVIDTQLKADQLPALPQDRKQFAEEVSKVNRAFPGSYSLLFGQTRCSCGIAINR
jgi:carbonic anhydrase/acetyltransferase-like protein (isoleucine patch superfamily)